MRERDRVSERNRKKVREKKKGGGGGERERERQTDRQTEYHNRWDNLRILQDPPVSTSHRTQVSRYIIIITVL